MQSLCWADSHLGGFAKGFRESAGTAFQAILVYLEGLEKGGLAERHWRTLSNFTWHKEISKHLKKTGSSRRHVDVGLTLAFLCSILNCFAQLWTKSEKMAQNRQNGFLCYVTVLSRKRRGSVAERRGKNSANFVSKNVAEFGGSVAES